MPAQLLQIITLTADVVLFLFIAYYFLRLRAREKALSEKETKIDAQYHQVVDTALARERKIIDDATAEADLIIAGAKDISLASKEKLHNALNVMVVEMHKEAVQTARIFLQNYQASLQQLGNASLVQTQTVTKTLEAELQIQMKHFHDSLLPTLEKELEEYKAARFRETEQLVAKVIQRASQEILNKSISLEDHHALMIASLEKAKREGVFG